MSEINLEPRNYKKIGIILAIIAASIISLIFILIGLNSTASTPDGGGG